MPTRHLLLMAAGLFSGAALADEPVVFYGFAYSGDRGEYLYTERHEQNLKDGLWERGSITYFDPDGREIASKTLDFRKNPYVPIFHLKLASGYEEGISAIEAGRVTMFRKDVGSDARETETVRLRDDMAADSGFHSLIYENLDAIVDGDTRKFRFAVAGNLDTFSFRVRKTGDTTFDGEPAVVLTVEAATLLRFVAPSLELVYDPEAGRLLEYRGLSNLHDPDTGKPYPNVRISYAREVPDAALQAPGIEAYRSSLKTD